MLKLKKPYSSITAALLLAPPILAMSLSASAAMICPANSIYTGEECKPDPAAAIAATTDTVVADTIKADLKKPAPAKASAQTDSNDLLVSTSDAPISLTPAAPAAAAAAPAPAPTKSEPTPTGEATTISTDAIGTYISGFRTQLKSEKGIGQISFLGLGKGKCLRHLKIDLERPNDDERGIYAVRIEKSDLKIDGKTFTTEQDCKESPKTCTREAINDCTSINGDPIASTLGIDKEKSDKFAITVDTKVMWETENMGLDKGTPGAIKDIDIPQSYGGPLQYKSPATFQAENEKKEAEAKHQALVSSCKDAEKGNADEYDNLVELLGPDKAAKDESFLKKLKTKCEDAGFEEISKKIEDAKTIDELNTLIDDIAAYAKDHPSVKSKAVKALVEGIGQRALEIGDDDDGTDDDDAKVHTKKKGYTLENAKLKLIDRALKVARSLDPKNQALRQAAMLAKLKRFEFDAKTGDDAFYNNTTQKEAEAAYNTVTNWQSQSPNSYSDATMSAYQKSLAPITMPQTIYTPYGAMQTYQQVTPLDRTYQAASMQQVYDAYLSSMRSAGGSTGLNGFSSLGGLPSTTGFNGMGKY